VSVVSLSSASPGGTEREAGVGDPSIHVDTDGLREFADNVGFYATAVDPEDVSRSKQQFSAGVTFGVRNASGAVQVAKQRYAATLQNSLDNLMAFVEAARILASAAERAAADYQASDGRAAVDIGVVLNEARDKSSTIQHFVGPVAQQSPEAL
jgi:hypothetical protein